MSLEAPFYIDGVFSGPARRGELHPVVNPATEEVIRQLPMGAAEDVDRAVAAATRAFATFSTTTREERAALLERVITCYRARVDDLARAIHEEMGAPLPFALAMQVQATGLRHLETFVAALRAYKFEERLGTALIMREPIGVIAMITPWNWPLNQITLKVGAALAAGCTMVLKPSEFTPSSAVVFAEVLHAAGVPRGVFNLVHGSGPTVGAALAAHGGVAAVSFTGSTRAGVDVAIRAAPTVKRVSQELGGKSANIVLDDEGFAAAVRRGAAHCFNNCGQSCNAPTRMLVPVARAHEAAALAAEVARKTVNGPVVNRAQWDKIQTLIAAGVREGATLAAGGPGLPPGCARGFFVQPTVFGNVTNTMTVAREEIFGPVLVIIAYGSEAEAVAIANDTPYGLAAYVQGRDLSVARRVARQLRAGNVAINGAAPEPLAPFGGYKQSGNGREGGPFGIDDCLEVKAVVGWGDAKL